MDLYPLEVIFIGITAGATVVMVFTIFQLRLSLKQLRFQALEKTYDYLENEIKEDINHIYEWAKRGLKPEGVLGGKDEETKEIKENRRSLRYVSVAFNKVGYLVYKKFLDIKFIQEEFGGLIIKSFIAMKPYLEYERRETEGEERKKWFMRRFYLMIVTPCEQYMNEKYPGYIKEAFEKYGSKEERQDYNRDESLVPTERLADDVDKWLRKYKRWLPLKKKLRIF